MNPLSLTARAYRTYSELTLTFPDGVCAITGELAGEPGKSNGSGKSSIANAIDLALFGAQSRSLADEHNPAYGATMLIELVFEHAGDTYRVRRTYSAKGRGSTTVDLEEMGVEVRDDDEPPMHFWAPLTRESAKATQDEIAKILGFKRKVFRASSFLRQGDSAAFTNADPIVRRKILFDGLGLEVWDGLLKKTRFSIKSCELRVADVSGMIDRAELELAQQAGLALQLDQARENEQAAQTSLSEATARLATAREALVEARGRVERRAGAEKAAQRAEAALSELRSVIIQKSASLQSITARLGERTVFEQSAALLPALEAEREELRAAIAAWDERKRNIAERERWQDESRDLARRANTLNAKAMVVVDQSATQVCDRCERPLDDESAQRAAASYRADADALITKFEASAEQIAALSARIAELPDEDPSGNRWLTNGEEISAAKSAQIQLAALDEAQTRRDELAAEIQKMRAELPEREVAVATARAELEALGPHDDNDHRLIEGRVASWETAERERRERIAGTVREIARLEERLARLNALAGEVHLATRERDTLRDELELLTALERAYGPNGIPAYIVENTAIPQIEAEACRILRDLGTEYQVELHTQRETKAGGVADALDIVVYDGIRARPYEGFSGGEKTRIELALRIALAHLLANRRGAESRVLVIDEPDGLDSAGMAALADVLRRLHADGVFEKVLLVSHVAELRDAFEASIHVVCENGVSRVEGTYKPTADLLEGTPV